MFHFPFFSRQVPRILILEDELIIAADLVDLVEKMGYSVQGMVSSVEAALIKISNSPPDIILMDINMQEEFDGIEAAYRIRTHHTIPIVFISAVQPKLLAQHLQMLPNTELVGKPFANHQLAQAIKRLMHETRSFGRYKNEHGDTESQS